VKGPECDSKEKMVGQAPDKTGLPGQGVGLRAGRMEVRMTAKGGGGPKPHGGGVQSLLRLGRKTN